MNEKEHQPGMWGTLGQGSELLRTRLRGSLAQTQLSILADI